MRNKELLRKIINELIREYYKNVYSNDEKENMFLLGFIKGLQYSTGMDISSEFKSLKKILKKYKRSKK